ncbi:MAG TPA: iron-containing redox enzyme family protein [Longimicrobiales bacterium]|nr:iron-containing redox enzyme family protein [Longimicrobiales bacterium]
MSIDRIDDRIRERSLLTHAFYRQWSMGTLSREALAGYAREYFALVKAVPEMMETMVATAPPTLRAEIEEQRLEEAAHVPLWAHFAAALGISRDELESHEPLPETREAIAKLRELTRDFGPGACAMYALELEIPAIAKTKLEGLESLYGIREASALEYFREHHEADVRHAATWRQAVAGQADGGVPDAIERSLDAQHRLLDGCHRVYC